MPFREVLGNLPGGVVVDFLEADDAYLFVVDLPGASADTTEVIVDEAGLHIEARRSKDTPDGYEYVQEDRPVFVTVDVPIPDDASREGDTAALDRGVLEVRLPKRTEEPGQAIPVEEADSEP